MSYVVTEDDGTKRQFIVVAAGGYGGVETDMSDTLVAFTLED